MSDLKSIWADYKTREKSEPRSKLMELETKIHELEDKQGYAHYNFDKRWEKREKDYYEVTVDYYSKEENYG